jgi:hypothetical protein
MMGRRARRAVVAAAGLALPFVPLIAGPQAAGAATKQANASGQITFVDLYTHESDTCTLNLHVQQDTTAHTAYAFANSSGSGYACTHDVLFDVTIEYDDQSGWTHHATAESYNSATVRVDTAYTHLKGTVHAWFNDHLGPEPFDLTISASPK